MTDPVPDASVSPDRPDNMVGLELTFKSGATVRVDCTGYTIERNHFGNVLRFGWTNPDGAERILVDCELADIDAIVAICEPS